MSDDNIGNHEHQQASVLSTISSLKEIVTIVTGLTITNAIVQLFSNQPNSGMPSLERIKFQDLLLFILLTLNVIRFYHGNVRHLDTTYTAELGKGSSGDLKLSGGKNTGIDFFVIFFQSLAFAILSFILKTPNEFFIMFAALLVIDVIWFLSIYQLTFDKKAFSHQKKWTLNNTLSVFALLIILSFSNRLPIETSFYFLWGTLCTNTIIDYIISWDFYFPDFLTKQTSS